MPSGGPYFSKTDAYVNFLERTLPLVIRRPGAVLPARRCPAMPYVRSPPASLCDMGTRQTYPLNAKRRFIPIRSFATNGETPPLIKMNETPPWLWGVACCLQRPYMACQKLLGCLTDGS